MNGHHAIAQAIPTEAEQVDAISVVDFARWWLANRPFQPPEDAMANVSDIAGVTLFRAGPFQVQMFISWPNVDVTMHSHPDIDSVEVRVHGEVTFDTERREMIDGMVRVLPHEKHVARAGGRGGCFLSIQKWINGVQPSSVTHNWVGAPLDKEHAMTIKPTMTESINLQTLQQQVDGVDLPPFTGKLN